MTTSNKMESKNNTDYKDYSLSKLKEWTHDATQSGASPREVFETIFSYAQEELEYHEKSMGYYADFLAILRSGGKLNFPDIKIERTKNISEASQEDWTDFWECSDPNYGYEYTPIKNNKE